MEIRFLKRFSKNVKKQYIKRVAMYDSKKGWIKDEYKVILLCSTRSQVFSIVSQCVVCMDL